MFDIHTYINTHAQTYVFFLKKNREKENVNGFNQHDVQQETVQKKK